MCNEIGASCSATRCRLCRPKPCLISQKHPDMGTSEKKLPTRRAQTEVANSLDSLQRKRLETLAPEWLAPPMETVRKHLRTKNKSIFKSIIYKKVCREEHLQAHKENGKSQEWMLHRKEKRKQNDEEGQRRIVGVHFTTTQQKGRIHPLRSTVCVY